MKGITHMAHYPTSKEIQLWTPYAVDIFKTFMPPIPVSYPEIYTSNKNYSYDRAALLTKVDGKHTEEPPDSIMEYIHGDKGGVILIRQNLIPDKNDEHFCWMLWHELGHFYAINSERTDLHHYNDPGLADDSHNIVFDENGNPVSGLSEERLKQEGYWFWQEFIAEAISKYVSYKHRSTEREYHPEMLDWHPNNWGGIVDKLMMLLDETITHYPQTIDEYSLAHYFANLLMDDFVVLYVRAAEDGKLKVYDNSTTPPSIVYPDEPIEPTCISDIGEPDLQEPLWRMKDLLENQTAKKEFWMIDEDFLLDIGRCIGELMLAKFILNSQHMLD